MRNEIEKVLDKVYHCSHAKEDDLTTKEATSHILSLLEQSLKKDVEHLRQWLNEDRITDTSKLVTNEELLIWLSPEVRNACLQEIKEKMK